MPDPFDLTPAIPPKPVAEDVAVDDHEDKLYLEELLPESEIIGGHPETHDEEVELSVGMAVTVMENNNNNNVSFNNDTDGDLTDSASKAVEESEFSENNDLEDRSVVPETALDLSVGDEIDTENGESSGMVDIPVDAVELAHKPTPLISGTLVPEVIREKVDLVATEEILEKIPELTPEEVAIDGIVEGTTEETQPHIPESVSEGERPGGRTKRRKLLK